MELNAWKLFFFFLLCIIMEASDAAKILIVRHEKWSHPVQAVFKKYDIDLYKVHYSKDGVCPTFYAKFKYSLDPKTSTSIDLNQMYLEILKANFSFPYALVDQNDNIKINVGWSDATPKKMLVEIDKASSLSKCPGNSHAHVDD